MIKIYSPKFHQSIKDKVVGQYLDLIKDIRSEIKTGLTSTYLSNNFLEDFKNIIFDKNLDTYSSLKFYWTGLLNDLIYIVELHEEAEESSLVEEEIFSFWENSDFAEAFFALLDEGRAISDVSTSFITILENQILSYYHLHIGESETNTPLLYTIFPEIGDSKARIYLTDAHKFCAPPGIPDSFPSFSLNAITPTEISFNMGNEVVTKSIQTQNLNIEDDLYLLPNSVKGIENFDKFKKDITRALNLIKEHSPNSYNTFKSFTHSIVPIDEPGVVSFSMQTLPGYSSINMFDRDFIDLMDDLLHENGHHFLNTFLNFTDLLKEDDDKIYYSPWRKALRPVRGIYHACFTFFWALNLFGDLLDVDLPLSNDEKEKIKIRFIEEYYMLSYCYPDLEHSFKNGKINPDGMELINQIYKRIKSLEEKVAEVLNSIEDKSGLITLQADLESKRKKYELK
ncbi:MAG: hypothetical protein DRQ89_02375 [Epsilonproteobacteria bacterium]|nr:MAG: hypothetical protein DRQ89_02375 [Campylobacterota bacterium]